MYSLKNLHVLASVFHSLAFRFGHDFVLIAGASPASKLHGEGDADVTAFDVPAFVSTVHWLWSICHLHEMVGCVLT